jgi:uncharacterized protein (DUF302 family)
MVKLSPRDFIELTGAGAAVLGMGIVEYVCAVDKTDEKESRMERKIEVLHVSMTINVDFESFTKTLEQCLGRFESSLLEGLDTDPGAVKERIKKAAGGEDLMLFSIRDHGKLLNILGCPQKAKQYVLGNPLIAATMTRHDIRAGLYAPLRMLVYGADDQSTRIEFDRPSSLFEQFDNPDIMTVARSLDTKLLNLISKTELLVKESSPDRR